MRVGFNFIRIFNNDTSDEGCQIHSGRYGPFFIKLPISSGISILRLIDSLLCSSVILPAPPDQGHQKFEVLPAYPFSLAPYRSGDRVISRLADRSNLSDADEQKTGIEIGHTAEKAMSLQLFMRPDTPQCMQSYFPGKMHFGILNVYDCSYTIGSEICELLGFFQGPGYEFAIDAI